MIVEVLKALGTKYVAFAPQGLLADLIRLQICH